MTISCDFEIPLLITIRGNTVFISTLMIVTSSSIYYLRIYGILFDTDDCNFIHNSLKFDLDNQQTKDVIQMKSPPYEKSIVLMTLPIVHVKFFR